MARKTFPVETLREQVNTFLALPSSVGFDGGIHTEAEAVNARAAVIGLLESVLFQTDNYAGYCFLPTETEGNGVLRDDYDPTRRRYL